MFFTNQQNKNIIRLGDTTNHGGKVITAEDRMPVYGKPLARIGDMVWCPRCENQYPIIEGDETMPIFGRPIAFEGHRTACGAKLISSLTGTKTTPTSSGMGTNGSATRAASGSYAPNNATSSEPYAVKFLVLDDYSRKPMPHTDYFALVDGVQVEGKTDHEGVAEINNNNLTAQSRIEFHADHLSPKKTLTEADIGIPSKDACFITETSPFLAPQNKFLTVSCNNRAATRQAILHLMAAKHGTKIKQRSNWGASPPKVELANDWDYKGIVIHHHGNSGSCSYSGVDAIAQQVQYEHMTDKKFDDIGYHYVIECSGAIAEGRDIRNQGAHVNDNNTGLVGIMLQGDYSDLGEAEIKFRTPSTWLDQVDIFNSGEVGNLQYTALKALCEVLLELFNIEELGGHREFALLGDSRTCPGNLAMKRVNQLRRELSLRQPTRK